MLILITFVTAFLLYSAEGFTASLQLFYVQSSLPVSIGEAVLFAYLMVIIAAGFMAALVMFLAEVFHSSVGTLATATAIIILPMMVSIPDEHRLLAQLWNALPGDFVAVWNIFSSRTVVIFQEVFLMLQAVPVLYFILGAGFAFWAKERFVKYQVSGR